MKKVILILAISFISVFSINMPINAQETQIKEIEVKEFDYEMVQEDLHLKVISLLEDVSNYVYNFINEALF